MNNIFYYVCVVCAFCFSFITKAQANLLFHKNTSFVKIESNPNPIISKPTPIKLAAVSFLQSDTNLSFGSGELDVKTKCATLGYVIPVSECSSPMVPSYLCSSELADEGASNYTTGCCNANLYTVTSPDLCDDNATALKDTCYWGGSIKYRCSCDRSRYPYSELSGEGCSSGDFNVNNVCRARNASGNMIEYYASCCPSEYKECDANKHLVGSGNSCRISKNGTIVNKYELCECSSSYDTICADSMLIDSSDFCIDDNNRKFTRDTNCETACNKTSETNLDSYLQGYLWHCLYKDDGANVKSVCDGYNKQSDSIISDYYDECKAQGYTKRKEDCYISDLILYCPSDSSKVWCLDSKYCTGYDVGRTGGKNACNVGAIADPCDGAGVRCKYKNSECNKCWNDGEYNSSQCENLDTSNKGDSQNCCERGYIMRDGVCRANNCSNQTDIGGNLLYPYVNKNPGVDAGELEICYQGREDGDGNPLGGYDVYYGYNSCNSDSSKGGLWKSSVDNPRKCVCNRKDDVRGWLPFDATKYFDSSEVGGFYQGGYGVTNTCTDSEGSYYGYSSCYIGSYIGTTEVNNGMCLKFDASKWIYISYIFRVNDNQSLKYINDIINIGQGNNISIPELPLTNNLPDYSKVYCINKNMHCPNDECDEDVRLMTYNPISGKQCIDGVSEDCNVCYHIANLDETGKWHRNFKLNCMPYSRTYIYCAFEKCPDNYRGGLEDLGIGNCFKYCSKDKLYDCRYGDIITTDGSASGSVVGVIYYSDNSNVYITAVNHVSNITQAEAIIYANDYAPTGVEDNRFKAGSWYLPTRDQFNSNKLSQFALLGLRAAYRLLEKGMLIQYAWTSESGYGRDEYSANYVVPNGTKGNAVPIIICPKDGGACE